jgi:SAM-dependent methyltransferase
MGYTKWFAESYYRKRSIHLNMKSYWTDRKNFLYYKKIIEICSEIIKDNKNYSIIDFGCKNTEIIFNLKCDKKFLLDRRNFYNEKQKKIILEKNIKFLEQSIYDIEFENEFDICICLQTLEHLEYPEKAFKLIHKASKKYTIISLPYKWKSQLDNHSNINEQVIKKWTGIEPDDSFVIKEGQGGCSSRIINVYIKK